MKHQQSITEQRLVNMKKGIEQADKYLNGLHVMMLNVKEINAEELGTEIEEIQCFLQWVKEQ